MSEFNLKDLEQLIERKIKATLADMLGLSSSSVQPGVLSVSKAVVPLGYDNVNQIYRDIATGLLRVGLEVEDRRRPGSDKPRYYIDIPAARKRLASDPHRRRPGK